MAEKWLMTDVTMIVAAETQDEAAATVRALPGWRGGGVAAAAYPVREVEIRVITTSGDPDDAVVEMIGTLLDRYGTSTYFVEQIEPPADDEPPADGDGDQMPPETAADLLARIVRIAFDPGLGMSDTAAEIIDTLGHAGYPE